MSRLQKAKHEEELRHQQAMLRGANQDEDIEEGEELLINGRYVTAGADRGAGN